MSDTVEVELRTELEFVHLWRRNAIVVVAKASFVRLCEESADRSFRDYSAQTDVKKSTKRSGRSAPTKNRRRKSDPGEELEDRSLRDCSAQTDVKKSTKRPGRSAPTKNRRRKSDPSEEPEDRNLRDCSAQTDVKKFTKRPGRSAPSKKK
ncbi:hypothetical protein pipiens_001917 [Culex pipiens pipiens]|uniref:Uncharacterized protein n=1 Tax=Culex pipiens pipiens TaxID=38569 RepID=A0ABD1DQ35_CULPP